MTVDEFIKAQGLEADAEQRDSNPNMDGDWDAGATHWLVTITRPRAGSYAAGTTMAVPFSQGSAHENPPGLDDVLDCLASDAASIENARDFADWCADYGYDTDSRKAERTYNVTKAQSAQLKAFLGDSAYETLLFDTERL